MIFEAVFIDQVELNKYLERANIIDTVIVQEAEPEILQHNNTYLTSLTPPKDFRDIARETIKESLLKDSLGLSIKPIDEKRAMRNIALSKKVDELYEKKIFTDKANKLNLHLLLVNIDQARITRNDMVMKNVPEIVIQAISLAHSNEMLTSKEIESIVFNSESKNSLIDFMNIFSTYIKEIQKVLPKGKNWEKLMTSKLIEDIETRNQAIKTVRPKILKAVGLDKLK